MTSFETKEIRGLNWRNLIGAVVGTVSVVTTILLSYSDLKAEIAETRSKQEKYQEKTTLKYESDARYDDLRLTVLEKTVTLLQLQIDNLKK